MDLQTPVASAGRAMKMYASRLEKLGIFTLGDFLTHIPSRYEDFSLITPIEKIHPGEVVTIQGKVEQIKNIYTRFGKKIQEAFVNDETGTIKVIWFNQQFLIKAIHQGDIVSLSGRVEQSNNHIVLTSPEYEIMNGNSTLHTGRLVPIYPETKGISSKWLRRQIYKIIHESSSNLIEHFPYSIIEKDHLIGYREAIEQIHFPISLDLAQKAKQRLSFDEVFFMQLAASKRRREWKQQTIGTAFTIEKYKKFIQIFWEQLSFELTSAQRKVIHAIFEDMEKSQPMNRLVQGDVGSGKTVVAATAMYLAYLNGFQSILMAPTQILAEQHYRTIKKLLEPFNVKISLRTGNKRITTSSDVFDILVGTHAVLSEKVKLNKLGFVVIDEQHRFGVEQRAIIREKGNNPHVLTMTATPIPRTVALTLYGDLDLSVIDEMPKGRKLVKTWLVPNNKRDAGYQWIEKQIVGNGDQAFIVCPFIEESETNTTIKAATKEFERLQKEVFPHLRLAMLHGKMKAQEKDVVLQGFKNKDFDILVATPVVEVGIDIPNATIMVIEASERFGLAQLHQLRGRVGRGNKQSYCLLYTESANLMTRNRLKSLEKIYNGAELAELDLKMRGAGDIYGTQQSGWRMLKIASFSDVVLIEKAKRTAEQIVNELNKYPLLQQKLHEIAGKEVSPD
jgi:ATP-dependent DNA helicase RecG